MEVVEGDDWEDLVDCYSNCGLGDDEGSDYGLGDDAGSDYGVLDDEEEEEQQSHLEEDENEREGSYVQRHDYVVLSEADIRERQERDLRAVCSVLSVPRSWACALLVRYKWDVGKLQDAWFTDEEVVRGDVGLLEGGSGCAVAPGKEARKCRICLEERLGDEMSSTACGHLFCVGCWGIYVRIAIADGPGCLMLRCPDPDCRAIIGKDVVERFATEEDAVKYSRHLFMSYVNGNDGKFKWCPAPDCQFAVEMVGSGNTFDVRCNCSHDFCWKCGEEAHRPVDCDTVAKWMLKNSSEAENTQWILTYCKPCPKCRRQIEKDKGCMHMTCKAPCNHNFCWLCLGDWSKHGESTGGFFACNAYTKAKEAGELDEEVLKSKRAEQSLEMYAHYFERWAANLVSRQKALEMLAGLDRQVETLKDKYSQPHGQLKFLQEAWQQIAECRRVLRWSYAYGYYLAEEKNGVIRFFEYLQGEAEAQLNILHSCAEKGINVFLDSTDPPLEEFVDYRSRLAGRTSVVQRYFDNLVRALESGLRDVSPGNKEAKVRKKRSIPSHLVFL